MKNSVVIREEDFERYKIPISIKNFFSNKKEKILCNELEKRHPCFSDDFCFYAKDKISKHGLFLDVFVMDKSKLAEYKRICKKSYLLIDGKKRVKVFVKKNKILFILLIITMIILLFLLINNNNFDNANTKTDIKYGIDETLKELVDKNYNYFDKKILFNFFNIIRKNNGVIKNISWNLSENGELITGNIFNLYPSITYEKSKPIFDFTLENKFYIEPTIKSINKSDFERKENVRKFLKNNSAQILVENAKPLFFCFELRDSTEIGSIIYGLNDILMKNQLFVTSMEVECISQCNSFSKYKINLTLSENKLFRNNVLEYFSKNLDLFENSQKKSLYPDSNKTINQNREMHRKEAMYVGEVNYKSGKKVVFYKDNEGKIIKEELKE